jgi:hypothetical protein
MPPAAIAALLLGIQIAFKAFQHVENLLEPC